MSKVVLFGGTTEGRELCDVCSAHKVPVLYCVATLDGARAVETLSNVETHVGRLDANQMAILLKQHSPALVIDATHPYAKEVSRNIRSACQNTNISLLRVKRESVQEQGDIYFDTMEDLVAWLETVSGSIFATMGSSSASALSKLTDYKNRIWLRILPGMERVCLDLGYPSEHLICMQGPFSEEANRTMFRSVDAKILISKSSGTAGGFPEKIRAAQSLGMITAVLTSPEEPDGVSLEEAKKRLVELKM